MPRRDLRRADQLRPVRIERGYQRYPAGSALIEMGHTRVVCAATVEERVPFFLKGSGTGWVTAEYSMLPGAGSERTAREAMRGHQTGRTQEIQRLIGRALRTVVDMKALGERTIHIDCDVLQADGGTRTASITGAFVALVEACATFYTRRGIFPVRDYVAAVSVGISTEDIPLLDLCYEEDSSAMVDMNIVMTGSGALVEVQGTGEGRAFSRAEMNALMDLGGLGIRELIDAQKIALGDTLAWMPGREG
ncbi:ribonuclease PH [Selenomonas sp. oral taxon 126]|uniref:ribonuclease PH n=1 Tax=Selenomonas sp. oral taxon 126 TaxID=712528 RepID=UPI00080774D6|nr:ribonuclease PH [Selenomonas sp. oral taxon 126]ANR70982.1 ribonuclease PH [Selenomonas sp. oral taxon 126]